MRLHTAFLLASLLAAVGSAHGASIVIDNFSCPNSVSLTGATGFNSSYVSCPGSIGGQRQDFIFLASSNGTSSSVSTMNSDPPAGAIIGTFGSGIDDSGNAGEGMVWGTTPTGFMDLGLNLTGDSLFVQIQSNSGGSVSAYLSTTPVENECNCSLFSMTFSGDPGFQDVLIPLTGIPTVAGVAANLSEVNTINLVVNLNDPGSSFTIDAVDVVSPEPSNVLLMISGVLLLMGIRARHRQAIY